MSPVAGLRSDGTCASYNTGTPLGLQWTFRAVLHALVEQLVQYQNKGPSENVNMNVEIFLKICLYGLFREDLE